MQIRRKDFDQLTWQLHAGNPVLRPPRFSPIIADPSFLTPSETPDGKLHLFAHALAGIYNYRSDNGIDFSPGRLIVRHAMRPFLMKEGDTYYLLYERYRPFQIYFSWVPVRWRSRIEMRKSKDLVRWSAPTTLLEPGLAWHTNERRGSSVGNPCLVPTQDGYHLYYSANLVHLEDCGFNEPRYFGLARARSIEGPYESLPEPIMGPDPDDPWLNMGCGSIKAMRADDGYVGLMNSIYRDTEGRTRSAILSLGSDDGESWERVRPEPLLKPTDGWMKSHVYAFDFRPDESRGIWRLYFNARNDWHWSKGSEAIGLLTAPL